MREYLRSQAIKRLLIKTEESPSGCLIWTASYRVDGRPQFWFEGQMRLASRVAFYLGYGVWPEHNACHHCDNPACVNYKHMFDGTQKENIQDMMTKGRGGGQFAKGHNAKIKEEHVEYILNSPKNNTELAKELGVTQPVICMIRKRARGNA